MSTGKRNSSITERDGRRRVNQRPINVDHSMDWQSPSCNKSKRSRSDKSNEILTSTPAHRSRSSVTREEIPLRTMFPLTDDSQKAKPLPSADSLHQNSQLENDHYSSLKSLQVRLASPETMSIDRSIQDLVNRPRRPSISSTLIGSDLFAKSTQNYQHYYHEKIKTADASTKKSLTQSQSQLQCSKDKPISMTRSNFVYPLSISTRDEEMKASIRDIPRLSRTPMKITRFPSRDEDAHATSQKRIRTESVPECLDLTVMPTRSSEKTVACPLKHKQDDGEDILQPSKSPSKEASLKKTDTARDSPLSKTNVQHGRCGLRNIGNTCFMNSALQCLSNVCNLTEYILKEGVTNILNTTNDLGTHGKLAVAYADLIKIMWSGTQTTAEGSAVKRYVSELSPRFMGYSQQDSHEFLNVLLDALHEDLKQDSDNVEEETSLISEIFHGLIRSIVTCVCGEPLTTFDSISFLALPIPVLPLVTPRRKHFGKSLERPVTLIDCFHELFKVERISENGQWFCNKCNCLMDAEKKLELWTPPKVLILQLKRFTYDILNNVKIQTFVEFPFDSPLDLRQFITDPDYDETTLYDLVAISSHTGSLAGGHYTTYAKNFRTEKWLHFNDELVTEADEKSLQSPNAYVFVYRRQETNL